MINRPYDKKFWTFPFLQYKKIYLVKLNKYIKFNVRRTSLDIVSILQII